MMSPAQLGALYTAIGQEFVIDPGAEITIEVNPKSGRDKLHYLREIGFNRLSIGMQSSHKSELELLGRIHTYDDFVECFIDARDAGFKNISVDIMTAIPGQTEQMQALREALSHVTATRISDRIYEELYSKMIVNACITSLGAICGLLLGQMMNRRDARRIFLGIIREAVQVADRLNLKLPPYGGKLDYARLMHGNSPLDDVRRHVTIWVVGVKYRHLKSSSLQSLERGQKTEVDGFNGYIAEKGRACGVDCPVNARLVEMIHEIEQGKRKICTDNLQDAGLVAHC